MLHLEHHFCFQQNLSKAARRPFQESQQLFFLPALLIYQLIPYQQLRLHQQMALLTQYNFRSDFPHFS